MDGGNVVGIYRCDEPSIAEIRIYTPSVSKVNVFREFDVECCLHACSVICLRIQQFLQGRRLCLFAVTVHLVAGLFFAGLAFVELSRFEVLLLLSLYNYEHP